MADDGGPPGKRAQRLEAKRNMYLTSTDQVTVHRRGVGGRAPSSSSAAAAQCQKCLQAGHWTFECANERVYLQRASRSQQLRDPKLRQPFNRERPPEDEEAEAPRARDAGDKKRRKRKEGGDAKDQGARRRRRKRRDSTSSSSSSSSGSSSDSSSSGSSSDSDSSSSSSSFSSSGDDRRAKRRRRD